MGKLIYTFDRLKEPGSQRAIMFLAGIFQIPEVELNNWLGVVTMAMGVLAVFTPEGIPETKIEGFSK